MCRSVTGQVGIGRHSSFPGGFIEIRSRCYKVHLLKVYIQYISIDLWSPPISSVSYFVSLQISLFSVAGSMHCWSLGSGSLHLLHCLLFSRLSVLYFLSGFHFFYQPVISCFVFYPLVHVVHVRNDAALSIWHANLGGSMDLLTSDGWVPTRGMAGWRGYSCSTIRETCQPFAGVSTLFNVCPVLALRPLTLVGGQGLVVWHFVYYFSDDRLSIFLYAKTIHAFSGK